MQLNPEIAFGTVLRKQREERDISQEYLALECGLDRTYISLLERGQRQPTLTTILRIAEAFKIPPVDLFSLVVEQINSQVVSE